MSRRPTSRTSNSVSSSSTSSAPPMSDEDDAVPPPPPSTSGDPTTTPTNTTAAEAFPLPLPTATRTPSFPAREDCWSEAATHTLIEAWGSHYLELNRGNLRQKHWQEVADAVNALHAHTKKLHRTDIQCKNRIDTLKKKYKIEKSKFIDSNGRYVSPWPFFASLDSLIGETFIKTAPHSPSPPPPRKNTPAPARKEFLALPPPPSAVPVAPRSKRPPPSVGEEVGFRRNFSAMATAAAAADDEDEEDEESETSSLAGGLGRRAMRSRRRRVVAAEDGAAFKGYRKLAEAIGRFGEIYERVEEAKQRQMVELEKQRMQFAKDLEIQRMKLFMESQVQLEKIKRSKRNSQSDGYS